MTAPPPASVPTPKLLPRQRQLLELLEVLGGTASELDFQGFLFLYCQEPAFGAPYDFVPDENGPFSFLAAADREKLIERGLLEAGDGWQLSELGQKTIAHGEDLDLEAFSRRHRPLRGDALLSEVFETSPFFATRSPLAARVLAGDPEELARVEAARPLASGPALFTIGYEGHSLERYLTLLLQHGVTLLCDVRRNPLSRKSGFSKRPLAHATEHVGIRYEHLPELGIASEQRRGLATPADYDALFDDYERTWLPLQGDALEKIHGWVKEGERVALTCYEHEPKHCHRHSVAEALGKRFGVRAGDL